MSEISEYINNDYRPIDTKETIGAIKEFFAEEHFTHFPIVEDSVYIGSVGADDVETFEDEKEIADYRYALEGFFARPNMLWLDVLELFARYETNVVPVLDETNKYVGYYESSDIIKLFHETPFLKEQGGIIIIEKGIADYSIGQITQIVESNNGKILGMFISEATIDTVQVTVKIAIGGMNDILQTFRRYNYEIISEHQEDTYLSSLRDRSDYLDKYLNI
ncbi:CBS domain-containing protein [Flavobacterium sp.]|uniref:CBS domain-containing protein n=1 Tax=Flavobacterium sp. TaxID=239 RepID=UPI0012019D48|nr:CBS domain-containing protein [Flavobacterium sp.]RZJ71359.1 MAG: CBS domain-containing protein [Flavobacterium sp.]